MLRRLLIILALWAAIYLPALGSLEIKGEEGRRILPAVSMLETGNYIVPQIGSEPYLRKPPLVNWLVAASFKLFRAYNEWTARLPSALCVLAVAVAFITIAQSSLGANGSLIAALIWLTNFGIVEKGRLIEIEALYVSLFGLAIICWLSGWRERWSPWLTWTLPFVFLGLGLLAKGPLNLIFFYAMVVAILRQDRGLRHLFTAAHLVGILIMLGIFAAWAIPYWQAMSGGNVAQVWSRQYSGRLAGEDFKFSGWILNIPRGLGYFLPWILLLPLARRSEFADERDRRIARGLGWGITSSFVGVSLIPGALSRYTMPLISPMCWLMATQLCAERVDLPQWLRLRRPAWIGPPLRLPLIVALIAAAGVCAYAVAVVPRLQQRQKVRTIAAQIDALVPSSERIYAVDPDFQPFLFYVQRPLRYVDTVQELPSDARYFLVRSANEAAAVSAAQFSPRRPQPILQINDYRHWRSILLAVPPP
jgi:4-amino-4-deoxy-L-arabinose transferase-like glycosyltransferase